MIVNTIAYARISAYMHPGILALDLDGTLTNEPFSIPSAIITVLERLQKQGWTLLFMTGRPFSWGVRPLMALQVPYYIAAINGANLVQMPTGQQLLQKTIPLAELQVLGDACRAEKSNYVLYGGYVTQDRCYYRRDLFAPDLMHYLDRRCLHFGEEWHAVNSFEVVPLHSCASVKSFGDLESCQRIATAMEQRCQWQVTVIEDPYNRKSYVAQATHRQCNKGSVLLDFIKLQDFKGTVIAAGDDYNDVSMLQVAHIKIVMSTAPLAVQKLADIIAPSASEYGLATVLNALLPA
jgi:hydroxymethylpyrimidine pyrophosphatase-like HAD family hydrolase